MQVGSATLDVRGMWCTSCANALERTFERQPGVLEAKVSFTSESASLEWDPAATSLDSILLHAEKLGYECVPEGEAHDRHAHLAKIKGDLSMRLFVAVFFSMWVMTAQWTLYVAPAGSLSPPVQYWLALFSGVMATPILGYCALPFFRAGWRTLRARAPGMDCLVALGASASCMLSVWHLCGGNPSVYFDSAAMIVTFLLAGRLLETTVRSRSSDAVKALLELPPEMAKVIDAQGVEIQLLAKRVERGASIRVLPGERIPLDGVVTQGVSSLDRSILTGETEFRTVNPGAQVEAGALNGDGELLICVNRVWGERRVDLIARSVKQMLARKTASQALAERFTRILVPAVCVVAALTLLGGMVGGTGVSAAIERAVSVLVITCPCALGMAVPLALSAGVGRAARTGILFRDVEALERVHRISLFFVDKTGTLTEGTPQLVGSRLPDGVSEAELIAQMAVAERGSEHPLAKAITLRVASPDLARVAAVVGSSRATPGAGVEWTGADGTSILAGSVDFLRHRGVDVPQGPTDYTAVHAACNGQWRGSLYFSDTPRAGAARALARIRQAGAEVAMLTGDHMVAALRVADAVGIGDCAIDASASPEGKAARIVAVQKTGRSVAFVGDGLNDGPALAAADFGVAVGSATASSIAAASVVLVDGGIEKLDAALWLARRTARAMRQNLAAAVIYNLLAIPLAASGWVSPAMAAALMVASSLSVTLNAARLAVTGSATPLAGTRPALSG